MFFSFITFKFILGSPQWTCLSFVHLFCVSFFHRGLDSTRLHYASQDIEQWAVLTLTLIPLFWAAAHAIILANFIDFWSLHVCLTSKPKVIYLRPFVPSPLFSTFCKKNFMYFGRTRVETKTRVLRICYFSQVPYARDSGNFFVRNWIMIIFFSY